MANPNPTDEELDRNWTPSGRRPQSTIARSFSAELMDIFRIENSVADLDESLDKRKQEVTTKASELEALERRIREMEERLQRSKSGAPGSGSASTSPRAQRQPGAFGQQGQAPPAVPKDLSQRASRPGTAKGQQPPPPHHGGALPPTPTASEGEYELVPDDNKSSYYNDSDGSGVKTRSFADTVVVSKDGDRDS
ncbi:hypothetical protein BJ170DRAFT_685736 [Xylariales sp. AK1849]|nr:hypothetical protein BJ170DRAFT_685736 [Xylariales sp. AK1849]